MVGRDSYVLHRQALYALLWMISVEELGLTAFRIRFTRSNFGTHDPTVAELLSVAIFTVIWVPLTFLFHRSARANASTTAPRSRGLGFLHGETSGNFTPWAMWLVGAAIATNTWPKRSLSGPGKQGRILITIVALAWVAFGLLTLAKMSAAMEYSARNAIGYGAEGGGSGYANGREKGAPGAGAEVGVNGGQVVLVRLFNFL